jgi:hypothetical protein
MHPYSGMSWAGPSFQFNRGKQIGRDCGHQARKKFDKI